MIDDELLRNCTMAADTVAMQSFDTGHEQTKAIVKRVLEFAEGNGLIVMVPKKDWPEYINLDPPFDRDPFDFSGLS